jgi:hypothetical protein
MLSNQKYNSYLKEIGDISGITKNLTTHVGRRTFASVAINHDVPAETIIKIIGHKNFKHLHLYAKVNEDKIVYDLEQMKKAFGNYKYPELPNNNLRIPPLLEFLPYAIVVCFPSNSTNLTSLR